MRRVSYSTKLECTATYGHPKIVSLVMNPKQNTFTVYPALEGTMMDTCFWREKIRWSLHWRVVNAGWKGNHPYLLTLSPVF